MQPPEPRDTHGSARPARFLVPVDESSTLRQTIAHSIHRAREHPGPTEIHYVYCEPYRDDATEHPDLIERATTLLHRVIAWATEDIDDTPDITIETARIGTDEFLFSPSDYARTLRDYTTTHDIDRIILDPEYQPGASAPMLASIEAELDRYGIPYEETPTERPTRPSPLTTPATLTRYAALFSVSFLFYLSLGDPTYWFDLVTGVATAAITAVALSHVTFAIAPQPRRAARRLARMTLYVPYLFWKILVANIQVAFVILHPRLPIDPRLTRYRAAVGEPLAVTTLANSITLTPGTLTVRAKDHNLLIHTLIPDARDDLVDGGLERAVRFVFYGRPAMLLPTPAERDDAHYLDPEPTTDPEVPPE